MNDAEYTQFGGLPWNLDALTRPREVDQRSTPEILSALWRDNCRMSAEIVYLRGLMGELREDMKTLLQWKREWERMYEGGK
jgi:hypothetical protein